MAKNQKGKAPASEESADPLAQALGPSTMEKFVEENKKLLLIGLIALVAVVSAYLYFQGANNANLEEAGRAYAAATSVDDLEKVMKQFPGTVVEGNAMLRKATLLDDDGDTDDAKLTLLEFRKKFPKHPRAEQAVVILGRMAESNGENEQAESFYSQVSGDSELYPYAQLHLGDLAMQRKDFEGAKQIYESIRAHFAIEAWRGQWEDRIERVERQLKLVDKPARQLKLPPLSEEPKESDSETAATTPAGDEKETTPASDENSTDEEDSSPESE